jgi:ATP/maltotriose-dependent transcriptional regulator MalT
MQAWNTLATVALYQGDRDRAAALIETAQRYTRGNVEYEIYTLANGSILNAMNGRAVEARSMLQEALVLAERGQNYLALHQMKDDISTVASLNSASCISSLVSEFQSLSSYTKAKIRTLEG